MIRRQPTFAETFGDLLSMSQEERVARHAARMHGVAPRCNAPEPEERPWKPTSRGSYRRPRTPWSHLTHADYAMSFAEIGRELGISQSRVEQIFNSGMRKLMLGDRYTLLREALGMAEQLRRGKAANVEVLR